mgnify:CR=1 FL=1
MSSLAELEAQGADGDWTWATSPCLGMCEQAPAILAQRSGRPDVALGEATLATVRAAVAPDSTVTCGGRHRAAGVGPGRPLRAPVAATGRRGRSVVDRRATARRAATRRCARAIELGPEGTIREITDAKLLGRGGAAFPTGVKWKAVAEQLGASALRRSATPTNPNRARSRTGS